MVPIVNENDTVATGEIRFGDNDRLAARTAQLVGAELLVLAQRRRRPVRPDPGADPQAPPHSVRRTHRRRDRGDGRHRRRDRLRHRRHGHQARGRAHRHGRRVPGPADQRQTPTRSPDIGDGGTRHLVRRRGRPLAAAQAVAARRCSSGRHCALDDGAVEALAARRQPAGRRHRGWRGISSAATWSGCAVPKARSFSARALAAMIRRTETPHRRAAQRGVRTPRLRPAGPDGHRDDLVLFDREDTTSSCFRKERRTIDMECMPKAMSDEKLTRPDDADCRTRRAAARRRRKLAGSDTAEATGR